MTEQRPAETIATAGSTFYDRNPASRQYRGRLVEMRSQEDLLRHVFWMVKGYRQWRGKTLWVLVGQVTGHGSGYSQQICEELGWDYTMKITPSAQLPERRNS